MLKKNLSTMTARKLRVILSVSIVVLVALAGAGFYLAYGKINDYAKTVRQATAEASQSNENLSILRQLETELKAEATAVQRTKSIVAESQSYQYQDQIISDLTTYAKNAGVGITSFSFNSPDAAGAGAAAAPAAAQAAAPKLPGQLKSTTVSVTLSNGASYESIIRLIRSIESNLTKMQLSGISITRDPTSGQVTVGTLTVEVYIR